MSAGRSASVQRSMASAAARRLPSGKSVNAPLRIVSPNSRWVPLGMDSGAASIRSLAGQSSLDSLA